MSFQGYYDILARYGFENFTLYGPAHGTGSSEVEGLWLAKNADFAIQKNMLFNVDIWLSDGQHIYFHGNREQRGTIWMLSLENGSERPLTALTGRRGNLGTYALATDGDYIYFTWEDSLGDLWVMDVIRE